MRTREGSAFPIYCRTERLDGGREEVLLDQDEMAARLPYLFATCRFAHYLKCIVRDKIGSFKEKDEMQRWLQDWILNYVDGDPAHSTETTKAAPARCR